MIQSDMYFDSTFSCSEVCPGKHLQTQINGGIKQIQRIFNRKLCPEQQTDNVVSNRPNNDSYN